MLRLTCIVTFTTTWVTFIVSSLLIVSAVSWSDGCRFLELAAARGWETAGLDGQSAAVLDGCLRGNSVAEEFNLTDALGFFEVYGVTAQEVCAENIRRHPTVWNLRDTVMMSADAVCLIK